MSDTFLDQLVGRAALTYLVLDGAEVENIQAHLNSFGISGRPLFRESADPNIVLAGPWLVSASTDHDTLARCVAAARGAGKGIFCLGKCAPQELYAHLRYLNAAKMPDGRVLYFRHYDSDVLAAIIPLLDAIQAAQLFGPAEMIALIGGSHDGGSVEKPDNLLEMPTGTIAFYKWQIDALDKRQRLIWRKSAIRKLRQEFDAETNHMSDEDFLHVMRKYQTESIELGLGTQDAIYNWARLQLGTNNEAGRSEILRSKILTIPEDFRSEVFVLAAPGFSQNLNPGNPFKIVRSFDG